MKKSISILCLALIVLSVVPYCISPVAASEITIPTVSTAEDPQPEEKVSISIEDICHAFSRLVNKGKQWIEARKDHITEKAIQFLKLSSIKQLLLSLIG